MNRRLAISVAVLTASAIAISGCATHSSGQESADGGDPCNAIIGGVVGGILGAVLDHNRRGRGAAIGAAVGALACVAVNAASRQTRTAQQVEGEYRSKNQGRLPPNEPVVQAYSVTMNPDSEVQSGEKLQVVSNMTVVSGQKQSVNEVKEVLTLTGPDGKNRRAEKVASKQAGSGSYENTFSLTLPKGVAPGAYPVKTQLYVNGTQMAERQQALRVIAQNDGVRYVLMASAIF
jgi:hypothetical protein